MAGSRRGAIRPGCLIWGALGLLVVVMIWKMVDFHLLGPASVRAAVNDAYDSVRAFRGTEVERRAVCREAWNSLRDSTDNPLVLQCRGPLGCDLTFTDDSIYVAYPDTIYFPLFGEYHKVFRIGRVF